MDNSFGKGVGNPTTKGGVTGGTPHRVAAPRAHPAPSASAGVIAYNRVPAGQSGGGEFASKGGGGGGGSSGGGNLDKRIAALQPGGTVHIGSSNGVTTHAERSGDGRTVRYVRSTPTGSEVFKEEKVRSYTVAKPGQPASFQQVMSMISNVPGGYSVEGRGATYTQPKFAQEAARQVIAERAAKAGVSFKSSAPSLSLAARTERNRISMQGTPAVKIAQIARDNAARKANGGASVGSPGARAGAPQKRLAHTEARGTGVAVSGGTPSRSQRLATQLRTAANNADINLHTFNQTPARLAKNFGVTHAQAKSALEALRGEGTLRVEKGAYVYAKKSTIRSA